MTFKRATALGVCRDLVKHLADACEPSRLIIAGSLRRRKATVGDIEIVYVSRKVEDKSQDLFEVRERDQVTIVLEDLIERGVLEKRANIKGAFTFGAANKLLRHVASGMPIDFFATSEECWFNYLVCRTGGAATNKRIATAAIAKGWKWNNCGKGFSRGHEIHQVRSEREVFEFVGLPYLEPHQRS